MSQEQASTTSAENVFEELDQELRRLKSAVSHLSLSESAATQAIEAAERVVEKQDQLSQQLMDYIGKQAQPVEPVANQQLAELTAAVAQQQEALHLLLAQLSTASSSVAEHDPADQQVLQSMADRQQHLISAVEVLQQSFQKGIAQYPSQQLAGFLQNILEPFAPPMELQPTLTRNVQLLQEVSSQMKALTSSTTLQQQTVGKALQQLSDTRKAEGKPDEQLKEGQLLQLEQTSEVQATLKKISAQLVEQTKQQQQLPASLHTKLQEIVQPLVAFQSQPQPAPAPVPAKSIEPDLELRRQVNALSETVVKQQAILNRQQTMGVATLVAVLVMLALFFLRG